MRFEVEVRTSPIFANGDAVVRDEMQSAVADSLNYMRNEIDPRTPRGVTSTLRQGNQIDMRGVDVEMVGRVFNPVAYAIPVEAGSKPHFPPPGPLQLWVQRKLGISDEKEARSVAFLIGRAISKRGTVARNFFRDGVAAARGRVQARFAEVPGRIVRRLAGGA